MIEAPGFFDMLPVLPSVLAVLAALIGTLAAAFGLRRLARRDAQALAERLDGLERLARVAAAPREPPPDASPPPEMALERRFQNFADGLRDDLGLLFAHAGRLEAASSEQIAALLETLEQGAEDRAATWAAGDEARIEAGIEAGATRLAAIVSDRVEAVRADLRNAFGERLDAALRQQADALDERLPAAIESALGTALANIRDPRLETAEAQLLQATDRLAAIWSAPPPEALEALSRLEQAIASATEAQRGDAIRAAAAQETLLARLEASTRHPAQTQAEMEAGFAALHDRLDGLAGALAAQSRAGEDRIAAAIELAARRAAEAAAQAGPPAAAPPATRPTPETRAEIVRRRIVDLSADERRTAP